MPFLDTEIPGLKIFEPKIWRDDRGYFYESYNQQTFEAAGITNVFVQDNQALSTYGILRGLHYQLPPYSQAKLVRVLAGEVLDVVLDIRPNSPTFGQHFSIRLSAANKKQLFVPKGFAHGYVVMSDMAIFAYKCDNFYAKSHDAGILFSDPSLNIDWQINFEHIILSEKDKLQPLFKDHRRFLMTSLNE
ncbi:MAG: dTDP-4-dehydrorhamnose 3,5-epimerase [Bacteroidota bacterium]